MVHLYQRGALTQRLGEDSGMTDMNYDGIGITIENYVAVVEIQRDPTIFSIRR